MFSRLTPHHTDLAVGGHSRRKPTTSELIDGATSPEHRDAMLDDSENDDEMLKVEPLRRSNQLRIPASEKFNRLKPRKRNRTIAVVGSRRSTTQQEESKSIPAMIDENLNEELVEHDNELPELENEEDEDSKRSNEDYLQPTKQDSDFIEKNRKIKLPQPRASTKDNARVGRRMHGSMFNTIKVDSNKRLLEEFEGDSADLSKANKNKMLVGGNRGPLAALRMKRVDIEQIYPQSEKDKEGEKLKRLCDMHEGQKSLHADGRKLIDSFVKPRRLTKLDPSHFQNKIKMSYKRSPDQNRFLRRIERQAWKFNHAQYMGKIAKAEAEMRTQTDDKDDRR